MNNENTNVENVQNTDNTSVEAQDQKVEATAETAEAPKAEMTTVADAKKVLDGLSIHDQDERLLAMAESSKIESRLGETKIIYVNEDDPKAMYGLRIQYPGSSRATELIGRLGGDGFDPIGFLNEAIKDVIVVPRINSVDDFFNTHKGLGKVVNQVANFLSD